jgi:zinc transport system permease protein
MQKAFLGGISVAIACSLIGVFLVLRKQSFVGEGLAHISFAGIAIGLLLNGHPLIFALALTVLCAVLMVVLEEKAKIFGDTSIAILSYSGFALGVLLVGISGKFNAELFSYLFGNILAISASEVMLSILVSIAVIAIVLLFFQELFVFVFDRVSAHASGINVKLLNHFIHMLTAVVVVISMRLVGIFLVSALMILPAATALQISKSFRKTLINSSLIGIVSVMVGLLLSYYFDLAAGATIILVNFGLFLVSMGKK